MLYVILSVFCSIIVAVLIKIARKREIDVQQMVLWNYPSTVLLTYFLFQPSFSDIAIDRLPIQLYVPLIVLLPSLFIFIALAIKYSGIVKTDVAQRMSLFIPLLASFLLFHEKLTVNTAIGISVGLIAVICSISWGQSSGQSKKGSFYFPAIVFVGMGIIDILFKQIAQHKEIPYITSMFIVFIGALCFALLLLLWKILVKREYFDRSAIVWGIILGVFNFSNIFFYMKAHRALPDNPSIVFTTMNIGVIVLGTFVGILLFKEKLSKINLIGLILAIVSIIIITYL
ncbi:EamA family transporter [Sphingobacterium rhinopitheci]|uniref:EamA family transporter n=1 Tax=Sphingobacterium rhinopitheci TaxID=2781960 RepID=UPI001F525CBB|nr:EamA family transporter [Sphingobacterium rhinopitheci]MCI0919867.1 EamA family transporter [Sphingobacterium rhinopitheci]